MREHSATLTPTLSLSEGEGAVSVPSPSERERVAVRAEPLSGEARAERVRGPVDPLAPGAVRRGLRE
jgi:hypothetical protein